MRHVHLVASLTLFLSGADLAYADDWPAWRGPGGQGHCGETDLPLTWSSSENVRWKVPLPARGNSTPVVTRGRVFVTQATDDDHGRWTYCFDRKDGRLLWRQGVVYEANELTHKTNPYCSSSPATDGERVVAWYGSAGVQCYDFEGHVLWKRDLGEFRHIWGNASSPVLGGDVCFLNCGPGPRTFLIALEKASGRTLWQKDIPGGLESGDPKTWTGSWSTPLFTMDGDRRAVVVSYPHALRAFDPANGNELWTCSGLGNLVYTSPLQTGEEYVAMSGFQGPALAVRGGGKGDVTESRRLWRHERAPQRIGSGLIIDGLLFIVNDNGIAECFEAATGETVWRARLGAQCWSSLVCSGDRLYSLDSQGTCFVFRAGRAFEMLARNELTETSRSSVSVSDGELFLRTYQHLWCIGKTPAKNSKPMGTDPETTGEAGGGDPRR